MSRYIRKSIRIVVLLVLFWLWALIVLIKVVLIDSYVFCVQIAIYIENEVIQNADQQKLLGI